MCYHVVTGNEVVRSLQEVLTDYALDEIYKNDEIDSEEQNKETVRFIEESNHSQEKFINFGICLIIMLKVKTYLLNILIGNLNIL